MHILFLLLTLLSRFISSQAICASSRGGMFILNTYGTDKVGCLFARDTGDDQIEFRIDTLQPVGYISFGLGSSMRKAEVFVAWSNQDGTVTVSRRTSSGHHEPALNEQVLKLTDSSVDKGLFSVTFSRPKKVADGDSISNKGESHIIWAWSSDEVDGSDPSASIAYHGEKRGASHGRVQLFTSESASVDSGSNSDEPGAPKKAYLNAHVFLMSFAWAFSAPIGIAISRFFKNILGDWWFRLHIFFMLVGSTIFSIIGLACIFAYVGTPWIDMSRYSAAGQAHVVLGVMVVLFSAIQVVSGFVIDRLFDAERTEIPIRDKLHWWLGRTAGIFGYVNVGIGLSLYASYGNDVTGFTISFALWTVLLIGFYVFASIKLGQTHDEPMRPTLSGYTKMSDPEDSLRVPLNHF